jgi:hypothetical protein
MQRALSVALGLGVLLLAFMLTAQSMTRWRPEHAFDAGDAGGDAMTQDAGAMSELAGDASGTDPLPDLPFFGGTEQRRVDGGTGSRMPDGSPVPPLPDGTPRQIRFGVVLVSYRGAESARPVARTREQAIALATELAELAHSDFHAAVRRGDDGSADDLGHIQRGVLEPAPEYMIFTLPKGGTSIPVDTPRGYWIARRID